MKNLLFSLGISLCVFLSACNDSGGGDSGPQGVTYTGNENAAVITSENATTLTNAVLGSESAGEIAQPFTTQGTGGVAAQAWPGIARNVVAQVSNDSLDVSNQVAVTFDNEIESCSGGGSVTLDGMLSDVDYTGTLTVTFDSCVEESVITDGETTFAINSFTDDVVDITVEFTRLSLTGAEIDITQTGTVRVQLFIGNNYDVITLNVTIEDGIGGEMLMFDNFVISHQYDDFNFPNNVTISWDGRLFHSDQGYVDVDTIVPFCFTNMETDTPDCGGEILLTGENNATLRITAISNEQVQLDLDEDGDGTVDLSRTITWAELAEEIDIAIEQQPQ